MANSENPKKNSPEVRLEARQEMTIAELDVLGSIARQMQLLSNDIMERADLSLDKLVVFDSNGVPLAEFHFVS